MSDNTPNWTDKLGAVGTAVGALGSVANVFSGFENARAAERMNAENLAFQRENLAYQKELQNTIFQREDTANQRTVADMRAAGLSPLTMSATNGAGQVISTSAPQNDVSGVMSGVSQKQAAFMNMANQMNAAVQFAQNKQSLELQREQIEADVDLKEAQAAATRGTESRAADLHPITKAQLEAQSEQLNESINQLKLLNEAQIINNNFLTQKNEEEIKQLKQNITYTAAQETLTVLEAWFKENDKNYLDFNGLTSFAPDWVHDVIEIGRGLEEIDPEQVLNLIDGCINRVYDAVLGKFGLSREDVDNFCKMLGDAMKGVVTPEPEKKHWWQF